MNLLIALIGAGSGGILLAIGTAANAHLRKTLHSAIAAAAINFMVGFTTLALFILLRVLPIPSFDRLLTVPWWAFLGGFLGATFVTLTTLVVPKLGLTTTTLTVVCSQMIFSQVIDRLGWFGMVSRPITASKMIAIGLLMMAITIIRLDDRDSHRVSPAITPKI
jgi:bacterial/archaeal transporter family-2 protein